MSSKRQAHNDSSDERLVEQAIALLMERGRIGRAEALLRLADAAEKHDATILQVAESLLVSEGLLRRGP